MKDINYREVLERLMKVNDFKFDRDLAVALDLAPNTLSTWRSRNTGDIDKIIAICDTNVNLNWLFTGEGELYTKSPIKGNGHHNNFSVSEPAVEWDSKENKLPLIPLKAIAGVSNGNNDAVLSVDCVYYDVPEFNNKADYLIRITGSSMSPKYHSGDIVACKKLPLDTFFQWNKVYVLDTEQGALVKRVKKSSIDDKHILLISENEKYDPFDIPKKSINALGLVVGVIRLE